MSGGTVTLADVSLLGHHFPRYGMGQDGLRVSAVGDYVHELHVQALVERLILAELALDKGKVRAAHDLVAEAVAYLRNRNHRR